MIQLVQWVVPRQVVDIHTYSTDACDINKIARISATWALGQGKRVRLQEFGYKGPDSQKTNKLIPIISAANELAVPFMPWELLRPENGKDYEFWVEGDLWHQLALQSEVAQKKVSAFSWPELPSSQPPQLLANWYFCLVNAECAGGSRCTGNLLADWVFCTQNRDCANGCCSKQFSDDGRYKCTPGGAPSLCGDAVLPNGQACSANGHFAVQYPVHLHWSNLSLWLCKVPVSCREVPVQAAAALRVPV